MKAKNIATLVSALCLSVTGCNQSNTNRLQEWKRFKGNIPGYNVEIDEANTRFSMMHLEGTTTNLSPVYLTGHFNHDGTFLLLICIPNSS